MADNTFNHQDKENLTGIKPGFRKKITEEVMAKLYEKLKGRRHSEIVQMHTTVNDKGETGLQQHLNTDAKTAHTIAAYSQAQAASAKNQNIELGNLNEEYEKRAKEAAEQYAKSGLGLQELLRANQKLANQTQDDGSEESKRQRLWYAAMSEQINKLIRDNKQQQIENREQLFRMRDEQERLEKQKRGLEYKDGLSTDEIKNLRIIESKLNDLNTRIDEVKDEQTVGFAKERKENLRWYQKLGRAKVENAPTAIGSWAKNTAPGKWTGNKINKGKFFAKDLSAGIGRWTDTYTPTLKKAAKGSAKIGAGALGFAAIAGTRGAVHVMGKASIDWLISIGLIYHIIQWRIGGWQSPSRAFVKWQIIAMVAYFIIILASEEGFKSKVRDFLIILPIFAIEWRWFDIVSILNVGGAWYAHKALWPTIMLYGAMRGISTEGKKTFMTKLSIWIIATFWIAVFITSTGAVDYLVGKTGEGLTEEQYSSQWKGVENKLSEIGGKDEFYNRAYDICSRRASFVGSGVAARLKIGFLVSDDFKKCIDDEILKLKQDKLTKEAQESVRRYRIEKSLKDSLTIKIDDLGLIVAPLDTTTIKTEQTYLVTLDNEADPVGIEFISLLVRDNQNEEEGVDGRVEYESGDIDLNSVTNELSGTGGLTVKMIDEVDDGSYFTKGTNKFIFTTRIKGDKGQSRLGGVSAPDNTKPTTKLYRKIVDETDYDYWRRVLKEMGAPIDLGQYHTPQGKKETIASNKPAIIDIKILNDQPINFIKKDGITKIIWRFDIFNSKDYSKQGGRISKIHSVEVSFPKGVVPDQACQTKFRLIGENRYSLVNEYVTGILNSEEMLKSINDVNLKDVTSLPICATTVDPAKFFSAEPERLDELFDAPMQRSLKIWETEATINYDYEIVKKKDVVIR